MEIMIYDLFYNFLKNKIKTRSSLFDIKDFYHRKFLVCSLLGLAHSLPTDYYINIWDNIPSNIQELIFSNNLINLELGFNLLKIYGDIEKP